MVDNTRHHADIVGVSGWHLELWRGATENKARSSKARSGILYIWENPIACTDIQTLCLCYTCVSEHSLVISECYSTIVLQ